jgi:hypothetical protein
VNGVVRVRRIFGRTHSGSCGLHDVNGAWGIVSNTIQLLRKREAMYLRFLGCNGSATLLVNEVRLRSIGGLR